MSEFYVSRALPIDRTRRDWMVVEGTDPNNQLIFHRNRVLHEHGKWMLDMRRKYPRAHGDHWPWWRATPPPRFSSIRIIHIRPIDRAIAFLVALYAAWEAMRR